MGYVVKLLAVAEQTDAGAVGVRVHPAMVPLEHPLAAVRESFNAIFVEGAAVGDLMFYGRGAGGSPTASAILGDLIDAAINRHKGSHASVGQLSEAVLRPIDDAESAYYLNLEVLDRPGVLAQVAGVFGDNGVSIRSMEQEGLGDEARLIFITHRARHADVQATLAALGELEAVDRIGSVAPRPRRRPVKCTVKYVSTRGAAPVLGFGDVLLTGLAADGGLYVPEEWPHLSSEVWSEVRPYDAVAVDVMWPFVEGSIERDDFEAMVAAAYATFDHPDVCPLVELDDLHLLELFWGPTLAFKDVALQLVGRLFDHELSARGQRATIVVATSGDTGSAAIEACVGRDRLDIVVLHPSGRVSDVQRRQMTTVDAPNVHNVAVEGTFDDCQDLVKALFADVEFRDRGAPVGHELDQLGPGDGAGRLLRHHGRPARAAAPSPCPPATSATSSPAGSPSGWACRSTSS